MKALHLQGLCVLLALAAGSAGAQTMLDQEIKLIEIHSALLALQPDNAPGAYQPGDLSVRLELIGIPTINGQTGGKFQFTASDKTFAFPRPRLALGLPAPDGFRAFVGISYVPPITIFGVNEQLGALETGLAWAPPESRFTLGIRGQVLASRSKTSVTDPNTRDTLDTFQFGGDLSAGYRFDLGTASLTPFAGVGVTHLLGNFRITSDNVLLQSRTTDLDVTGGLRLALRPGIEAVAEVVAFPGVLVHPSFSLAWTFDLLSNR